MNAADQFDRDVGGAGHARPQRRQLDLSGTVSNEWYSVGGPGSIVMRSRSMRSTTVSMSNTASGSMVAPRRKDAIEARFQAERVKVRVDLQIAVTLAQVGERRPLLIHPQRLAWFIIAPFGRPSCRGEDDVGDVGSADFPLERRTAGKEVGLAGR